MASATWGIENNLGNLITPTRACFNWAEEKFLGALPDCYLQIVMNRDASNKLVTSGMLLPVWILLFLTLYVLPGVSPS